MKVKKEQRGPVGKKSGGRNRKRNSETNKQTSLGVYEARTTVFFFLRVLLSLSYLQSAISRKCRGCCRSLQHHVQTGILHCSFFPLGNAKSLRFFGLGRVATCSLQLFYFGMVAVRMYPGLSRYTAKSPSATPNFIDKSQRRRE